MEKKFLVFLVLFGVLVFQKVGTEEGQGFLMISAIMPGEKGCKSCEFVEIYNQSSTTIPVGKIEIKIARSQGSSIASTTLNFSQILPQEHIILVASSTGGSFEFQTIRSRARGTILFKGSWTISPNSQVSLLVDGKEIDVVASSSLAALQEGQVLLLPSKEKISLKEFLCKRGFLCEQENPPPSSPSTFFPSDVVINEFLPNPEDGEKEWVELYNNTNQEIDLAGWVVEEGSGAQTKISGKILPKGFFVVEGIKGYLNNKGDIIFLKDPSGKVIDKVAYGNFDDGNLSDNAKLPFLGSSLARVVDGKDSDQDFLDFEIASKPTPGAKNEFERKSECQRGIFLSEVLPNPEGDDLEKEFIELKNENDFDVDLEGYQLKDESQRIFTISSKVFSSTKIPKKGFFVLWRKETKIALNNSGKESVYLFCPDYTLVDQVSFDASQKEGASFAKDEKGNWLWTKKVTPGKENEFERLNFPPKIVVEFSEKGKVGEEFLFDASDSFDEDGDEIFFFWDFGEGEKREGSIQKYVFKKSGTFSVKLEVKDRLGAVSSKTLKVEVLPNEEKLAFAPSFNCHPLISEFLPNPEGKDDGEWVELFNPCEKEFDLSFWYLDDEEGSSKPYRFSEGTKILPGEYLVFSRKETKIALNNSKDCVRLLDPSKEVVDEVCFEKAPFNQSFALFEDGDFEWTKKPTPGFKNELLKAEVSKGKKKKSVLGEKILNVEISKVKELEEKTWVKTKGIVVAEPGIFGKRTFYLGGSGIEVYVVSGKVPLLKRNQEVEVLGYVSEVGGKKRINTKGDQIKILGEKEKWPKPVLLSQIDEDLEFSLVEVEGKIKEKQGTKVLLEKDGEEIRVKLRPHFKLKLAKGDEIKAAGILKEKDGEFEILVRDENDVKILKEGKENPKEIVSGQKASIVEFLKQKGIFWPLLSLAVFLFLFFVVKFFLKI